MQNTIDPRFLSLSPLRGPRASLNSLIDLFRRAGDYGIFGTSNLWTTSGAELLHDVTGLDPLTFEDATSLSIILISYVTWANATKRTVPREIMLLVRLYFCSSSLAPC